jgi:hypothetical protein
MKNALHNLKVLMTNAEGWSLADQMADFGYEIQNVAYLMKDNKDGTFTYASFIFDDPDGVILETVVEKYKGKKNTRDKKQKPLSLQLIREEVCNELR